ncbi:hypothetical protein PTSG_11299 [Salpingoeca rosetta]|uniref:Uncharacterized protein n=1 Tax=Salpingoeca rosetta (strain ATCC 50818 / BSB-021) TaxID=946362 RepID=F2UT04_SALR5|nr:uncharacterized protein PTSG_11299 [Salpingoeca rosetta]EGD81263.1 hypothetical protein PTSG_11299 [Salpingoeca rosetta]|eukprot:XP_004987659.1 hypothetical protein PTSG_11299 [Salpingoeca rosetta]
MSEREYHRKVRAYRKYRIGLLPACLLGDNTVDVDWPATKDAFRRGDVRQVRRQLRVKFIKYSHGHHPVLPVWIELKHIKQLEKIWWNTDYGHITMFELRRELEYISMAWAVESYLVEEEHYKRKWKRFYGYVDPLESMAELKELLGGEEEAKVFRFRHNMFLFELARCLYSQLKYRGYVKKAIRWYNRAHRYWSQATGNGEYYFFMADTFWETPRFKRQAFIEELELREERLRQEVDESYQEIREWQQQKMRELKEWEEEDRRKLKEQRARKKKKKQSKTQRQQQQQQQQKVVNDAEDDRCAEGSAKAASSAHVVDAVDACTKGASCADTAEPELLTVADFDFALTRADDVMIEMETFDDEDDINNTATATDVDSSKDDEHGAEEAVNGGEDDGTKDGTAAVEEEKEEEEGDEDATIIPDINDTATDVDNSKDDEHGAEEAANGGEDDGTKDGTAAVEEEKEEEEGDEDATIIPDINDTATDVNNSKETTDGGNEEGTEEAIDHDKEDGTSAVEPESFEDAKDSDAIATTDAEACV